MGIGAMPPEYEFSRSSREIESFRPLGLSYLPLALEMELSIVLDGAFP